MAGEQLHDYDRQLCDYVVANIRQHLDDKSFSRWVRKHFSFPLREYLTERADPGVEPNWLLLNDDELHRLALAFDGPEEQGRPWAPYKELHQRYPDTVREVRQELSKQVAEDWSRACAEYAGQLENQRLLLPGGIEIVREWVWRLRRLLRNMGAINLLPRPEGQSPTPTTLALAASPAAAPPASEPLPIERMRRAIREHPKGRSAKPEVLIKHAKIGNQVGRNALRVLQGQGEYDGFDRDRTVRYRDRPSNET